MRWAWMAAMMLSRMAGAMPFGVCAHLGGGDEFAAREHELAMMEAAGITWARADFTWGYFERQPGEWKYDNYDSIVADAQRHQITLLPILCYNVDWAFPAHEHLDEWCNYVKTVVTRYGDRLPYWEVWNEPNISFWKPKPDAGQYTTLLKATYATIKAVNPKLQVVFGGTAGVPLDYLRQCFEQGACDAFDVLAVHPYQYPTSPDASKLVRELQDTRALLTEFGSRAPIWITEFGWPTHVDQTAVDPELTPSLIERAAKLRFPQRSSFAAAVIHERGMPGVSGLGPELSETLARRPGFTSRLIAPGAVSTLDPGTTQILVMPTGEHYPADAFPAMLQFVKDGGLLVHLGGVPFYYQSVMKDGAWTQQGVGEDGRAALHVGWKAWWTQQGLPEKAPEAKATADAAGLNIPSKLESTRWLTDTKLKGNDRFVPLVEAFDKGQSIGYPVALYLYDSDLKGGFMGTILNFTRRGVSDEVQGEYLPRALLLSLAHGVQNIFWYEFREGGTDQTYNEHRFGIIRYQEMTPKPAYAAYQALSKALGDATFEAELPVAAPNHALRFDAGGSKTVAVWSDGEGDPAPVVLRVTGGDIQVVDHLGRPVAAKVEGGKLTLQPGSGVMYVTGLRSAEL